LHNFDISGFTYPAAYVGLSFDVVNGTAHDLKQKLDKVFSSEFFNMMIPNFDKKLKYAVEGNKIHVAFVNESKVAKALSPELVATLISIQEELKVDQSVEAHLRFGFTPKSLL
jgi:hypothetical protein